MYPALFAFLRALRGFLLLFLCALPTSARPQNPEAYRLRIENAKDGAIEASADGGATWRRVGRVLKPARLAISEKAAHPTGAVLRSSDRGVALGVTDTATLRLLPKTGNPPSDPSVIQTNLPIKSALFDTLRPPPGAPVELSTGRKTTAPLPEGYRVAEGDALTLRVAPANPPADCAALIERAARDYLQYAIQEAKREKRKIVSGTLTVEAKLAEGEKATLLTFWVGEEMIGATNRAPYAFSWDTRQAPDGEYTVEVRAMDDRTVTKTKQRVLIVIYNASPPQNPPAKGNEGKR